MQTIILTEAKQAILRNTFDLNKATMWACLFDTRTKDRLSADVRLTNSSFSNGVFSADDVVFYDIQTKSTESMIVILAENEVGAKFPIVFFDVPMALKDHGDVIVNWNKDSNKRIFNINSHDEEMSYERFGKITGGQFTS